LSNRIASVKPLCTCDTGRAIQVRQGIGAAGQAKLSFVSILESARMSGAWLSPRSEQGCRISVSAGEAFLCSARSPSRLQPSLSEWLSSARVMLSNFLFSAADGDSEAKKECDPRHLIVL
jgi:hypothetical protein